MSIDARTFSSRWEHRRVAVVAGNGPSLIHTELDHLGRFDLIVCNRAYRIPELMDRRPSFWVMADPLEDWSDFGTDIERAIDASPSSTAFVLSSSQPESFRSRLGDSREFQFIHPVHKLVDEWLNPKAAQDLAPIHELGDFYQSRHSPMLGIQVALWQKYEVIVLVGCDHDFVRGYFEDASTPERSVQHAYAENATEQERLQPMTMLQIADEVRRTWGMYAALGSLAERMGATILDATPGGMLDVYPRLRPPAFGVAGP